MTRGKPLIFSNKPGSTVRAARKRAAESAFSAGGLQKEPPAELKDLAAARQAWRDLIKAHKQLPGELFNLLDKSFLVGYCLARQARSDALALELQLSKDYQAKTVELKDLLKARAELRMATRLVSDLEKQLYATPKSRAGVTPAPRELSDQELIARELAAVDRQLLDREDY